VTDYKIRTRTGRETFPVPEHTEVAAVAALGPRFAECASLGEKAEKRAAHAHKERQRFDDETKREIRRAARAGEPSPAKKLVKRLRALDDAVAEADYERDGAMEAAAALKNEALATLVKHAPALRAEAVAHLDADALRLATVHAKLREVAAGYTEHGGSLVLIERLRVGKSPAMSPLQGAGAQAQIALTAALDALTVAVAEVTRFMEQAKVAPMPTLDEIEEADGVEREPADDDEPTGDAMVIDTDDDDDEDDDD
jgi:hypothetical protein